MTEEPEGLVKLRGTARRLLWGALICLLLPAVVWLGTALVEGLASSGAAGRAPGLLSALLVLYVAPVGVVLLILGLVAWGWAWWLRRGAADRRRVD